MFQKLFPERGRWGLTASGLVRVAAWMCVGKAYYFHVRQTTRLDQPLHVILPDSKAEELFAQESGFMPVSWGNYLEYLMYNPPPDPRSESVARWERVWDRIASTPYPHEYYSDADMHIVRLYSLVGVAARLLTRRRYHLESKGEIPIVPRSVWQFNRACAVEFFLPLDEEGLNSLIALRTRMRR